MRKFALGAVIILAICMLSVCTSSEAKKGNYIISKEDQRVLVANRISQKDSETKTFAALKKNNVQLINYIIEDIALYNELREGDRVIVTPETNGTGLYVVMQSYPPQIVAGEIVVQKD
ncbi:hypothetical protein FHS16_001050 [Paenibacillus endophyticus]|uniref:DUF3221 domain-containing protein n=1 Tax=Paenibacillus endophyticus TaxID=1294268 RepID=A0A7W5G8V6_9BACL|nr:DUF3221 domain-containing protein [Paenibacillus endophyticus]MBB3151016.1 hypothetical protein [Paenibacillus endophyticus]